MDYTQIVTMIPIILSIIGLWSKMNTLVSKQEERIFTIQNEIKEIKRHNERQEEKIANKLDEIDKKLTEFMLHVGKCRNFKID